MFQKFGRSGAGLDHTTVRGQIALEHSQCTFVVNGLVQRTDHVVVVNLRPLDIGAHAAPGDCHGAQLQVAGQAAHQRRHATGVIKIFHQVGVTTGADVGNHRHGAAHGVKVIQRNFAMLARAT